MPRARKTGRVSSKTDGSTPQPPSYAALERVFARDPREEAERLTGRCWRDDPETKRLGLALHLEHLADKRALLLEHDDTLYGDSLEHYTAVAREEGLSPLWTSVFDDRAGGSGRHSERHEIWFHPVGVFLELDSFADRLVNEATLWVNAAIDEKEPPMGQGRIVRRGEREVWVGALSVEEGLRHHLAALRTGGRTPLWPWLERAPDFQLINRAERRDLAERHVHPLDVQTSAELRSRQRAGALGGPLAEAFGLRGH